MSSFPYSFLRAFTDAAADIRDNKETSLIAVLTFAAALTILGLFLLVYFNLNNILQDWSEKLQLVLYLQDGIRDHDRRNIENMIRSEPRIGKWDYLSKDDALAVFKKRLKGKSNILEGMDTNPLPASFNIYFKEGYRNYEGIRLIAGKFRGIPGVESLDYGGEWISRFATAVFFLKVFITAVGGLLVMGLVTIISNTIRLSVYSRADEIAIKKLVGATRWFIQAPFLAEGVIQGVVGVILSIIFLLLFYTYLSFKLSSGSRILMEVPVTFLPGGTLICMIILGALIGALGSLLSLRKLMRFDRSI